jgi:hypothetical protein
MNNNLISIIRSIPVTEENKVRLRCIIKELEALGAIEENEAEFILSGSECVGNVIE